MAFNIYKSGSPGKYYFKKNNVEYGPFQFDWILPLIEADVPVRITNSDWCYAKQHNEFAPYFKPSASDIVAAPPTPSIVPPLEPSIHRRKFAVAAMLLITTLGLLGYMYWFKPYLKDKNATRMYSYTNSLYIRSSPAAGGNYNSIGNILFGTEILVYSINGDWAECKANGKTGFVSLQYILGKKEFHNLNGILADSDTRDAISTAKCRKALLNYFNSKGIMGKMDDQIQKEIYDSVQNKEVWQVFTKSKNSYPNSVAYPRVVSSNSRFSDFACLIKNINTGKRLFLLFSFNDMEESKLEAEFDAPKDGYIKAVTKSYINGSNKYNVSYVY